MAFNRNMNLQRGNNSNNNSNNRMGNMANNRLAGRIGSVSPWESGVMPGRGILPTPNNNLNLNSLSSPQTTLALASNLISNLLRQQEPQSQQVPPSLLSLGSSFNAPVANYNNQQNYNQGRFNDRLGRQNMKNQRPQPYNKMGNRARDGNAGRRNQQSRNQSGNQRQNGNQRNDRSSKPNTASKLTPNAKKEQDKTSDKHDKNDEKAEAPVALSEENDETEESKKREWKDEKKERTSDKKDGAIKTDDTSDKDESENSKKTSTRHAESRYAEVPTSNMTCHVCNKHMWDGFSFENHLRGRAHLLMMDKLDESYKLKVELMRHELRVAEEARELTLTNSKRRGKRLSVDMSVREYCTMCDLRFLGPLSNHRKSEKHQQLKTFLHPRCAPCNKEFPSRIEYDEHCLTPGHMKNAVQAEEAKQKRKKDKLIKGEFDVRTAEEEEKDVGTEKVEKSDEPAGDAQDFVTDIPEVIEAKLKIPSYKHCRVHQLPVGKSLVKECTGYYCDRCRRFMITEEDMMAHLRSVTHYRNYIQEIKTLQAAAAAAAAAAAEKTNENEDKEVDKDVSQETSEPDAKRPKLEDTVDVEVKEDSKETDKYDPEQANESEEEDNQDGQNDNEEAITLNETDDILDDANENDENDENDGNDENDDQEDEDEEKEEPPKKTAPSTTRSRGGASPRVRGNRARRSRR